jgi:hypothetical protein
MTEKEIKANLNKKVLYKKPLDEVAFECVLTGGIVRKGNYGYFCQAELIERKSGCVIYARLEDVETIQEV